MDDAVVVSLLQQIVDGLGSLQAAVEENTEKTEDGIAWLGELLENIQMAVVECRERVDMEGSHVQDRLNEIKGELMTLPSEIGSYMPS